MSQVGTTFWAKRGWSPARLRSTSQSATWKWEVHWEPRKLETDLSMISEENNTASSGCYEVLSLSFSCPPSPFSMGLVAGRRAAAAVRRASHRREPGGRELRARATEPPRAEPHPLGAVPARRHARAPRVLRAAWRGHLRVGLQGRPPGQRTVSSRHLLRVKEAHDHLSSPRRTCDATAQPTVNTL